MRLEPEYDGPDVVVVSHIFIPVFSVRSGEPVALGDIAAVGVLDDAMADIGLFRVGPVDDLLADLRLAKVDIQYYVVGLLWSHRDPAGVGEADRDGRRRRGGDPRESEDGRASEEDAESTVVHTAEV